MSYRLIVAEDEEMDRIGLQLLLRNEFPDLEILEGAVNGLDFVKIAEKEHIDIAIVDIDMPGLSGIEAISLLRKLGCTTKIIMNTAYGEFDYAVEALKLQVYDFVLKPIRRDKIIESVSKCIKELEQETAQNDIHNTQSKILRNLVPIVSNEFVMSVITDTIKPENQNMYSTLIGIPLDKGFIISSNVSNSVKNHSEESNSAEQLYRLYSEFVPHIYPGIIGEMHDEILSCYIVNNSKAGSDDFGNWAYTFSSMLLKKASADYGLEIKIGVGGLADYMPNLHQSYQDSITALEKCRNGEIIVFDSVADMATAEIDIAQMDSISNVVKEALQYIIVNYHKDLSLELLADYLNVSVSHLSRLFKQEMDVNYIDYLTKYRIDMARELMKNRDYSIKEIAGLVGYRNHTYFLKIFKSTTGETTSEYRSKLRSSLNH